jgi:hypothetical protein
MDDTELCHDSSRLRNLNSLKTRIIVVFKTADSMAELKIEGVPGADLQKCMKKILELQGWARNEKIDFWAFRVSLLAALNESSEKYFRETKGTYREIAAFDNGVAKALEPKSNTK